MCVLWEECYSYCEVAVVLKEVMHTTGSTWRHLVTCLLCACAALRNTCQRGQVTRGREVEVPGRGRCGAACGQEFVLGILQADERCALAELRVLNFIQRGMKGFQQWREKINLRLWVP